MPPGRSPDAKNGVSPPDVDRATKRPSTSSTANAASFEADRVFCVHLPGLRPRALTNVSATMAVAPMARGATGLVSPSIGATAAPSPAASDAIDPGNAMRKLVHPLRNPKAGPYASRR
jgi:hypothetical protein